MRHTTVFKIGSDVDNHTSLEDTYVYYIRYGLKIGTDLERTVSFGLVSGVPEGF